jgi:hypothetical protein
MYIYFKYTYIDAENINLIQCPYFAECYSLRFVCVCYFRLLSIFYCFSNVILSVCVPFAPYLLL